MGEARDDADDLRVEIDEAGVMVVTLNRPGARNALSRELLEGLAATLERAAGADDVRALVLTGSGRAFCAGGDVRLMSQGCSIFGPAEDPAERTRVQADLQRRTVVRLRELGKPTVAIVNGPAVGAGLALALACDVRVAGASAMLMTGFGRVGLAGDFGCSWLLHDLVGRSMARELLFGSAAVSADDALRRGLVNAVHPDDEVYERGLAMARAMARVPSAAREVMMEGSSLACTLTFTQACERDALHHVRLAASSEHREMVAALLGNRAGGQA